jgi:hypothetical protein
MAVTKNDSGTMWRTFSNVVNTAYDLLPKIGAVVSAIGALLAYFGFQGAESPEFRFACFIAGIMFCVSVGVLLAGIFLAPDRWKPYLKPMFAVLVVTTLGLAIAAYSSTYEARPVDQLQVSDLPNVVHITFDANGSYMATEFNSQLRVHALDSREEWHVDDWAGVSNDSLVLHGDPPLLTVTRIAQNSPRHATIWSWNLKSPVTMQDYPLGPSSNQDPDLSCPPVEARPDQQTQMLAIAYKCSTAVVQQQAGGFVELVPLLDSGVSATPVPMSPPGADFADVPQSSSCYPEHVAFNDVAQYVIGVYECTNGADHAYHVRRWTYDGQFQSWTPILEDVDKWTMLGLMQGPDGGARIEAQHSSQVELWQPVSESKSRRVSWLPYDSFYGFDPKNVALSPDGRWAADVIGTNSSPSKAHMLSIEQFGVWFAGHWRTGIFDSLWPGLQQAASP